MRPGANVAVIGGGIAGLASAHFLLKAGMQPVVFEASGQLGGLGTYFQHDGFSLDRFYHIMCDSDADLLALIDEVGLGKSVLFGESRMGFHIGSKLYPLNSAADLLRFGGLSFANRIRVGAAGLRLRLFSKEDRALDRMTAHDWLLRQFGQAACERIWIPLLRSKFGDDWQSVPAYWMWSRLIREKGSSKEVKGYLNGGYRRLAETLRESIVNRGGAVRLNAPVTAVGEKGGRVWMEHQSGREEFDAVVSTLPLPLLDRITRDDLAGKTPLSGLRYQGVVNVVILSRTQLQPYYWTAVVNPHIPFQGVVETTTLIPVEWCGGRHLIYLMNYCAADSPIYRMRDDEMRSAALGALAALYPGYRSEEIEAVYVFRAPHVEPLWTTGYLERKPAPRVGATRLYLCTTAQAYPRANSWNTSVGLAKATVRAMMSGDSGE